MLDDLWELRGEGHAHWRFSFAMAAVDLATIRNTEGGKNLSPEMAMLLALVVFDGYGLFGDRPVPVVEPDLGDSTIPH